MALHGVIQLGVALDGELAYPLPDPNVRHVRIVMRYGDDCAAMAEVAHASGTCSGIYMIRLPYTCSIGVSTVDTSLAWMVPYVDAIATLAAWDGVEGAGDVWDGEGWAR